MASARAISLRAERGSCGLNGTNGRSWIVPPGEGAPAIDTSQCAASTFASSYARIPVPPMSAPTTSLETTSSLRLRPGTGAASLVGDLVEHGAEAGDERVGRQHLCHAVARRGAERGPL